MNRKGIFSGMLGLLIALLPMMAGAETRCTEAYLNDKEPSLEAFLNVREKESIVEAIERHYGCSFALPEIGSSVTSSQGDTLGEVAGIAIKEGAEELQIVINVGGFLGIGAKDVAVPARALLAADDQRVQIAYTGDQVQELAAVRENEIMHMFTGAEEVASAGVEFWSSARSVGLGFLPGNRIEIRFQSVPEGAQVLYDDMLIGSTSMRCLADERKVESIVIINDGYQPCSFSEGSYRSPYGGQAAEFSCDLKPLE